jgi:hypothetical protein
MYLDHQLLSSNLVGHRPGAVMVELVADANKTISYALRLSQQYDLVHINSGIFAFFVKMLRGLRCRQRVDTALGEL